MPGQNPEPKSPVIVMVFVIWGFLFFGLAWAVFARLKFARIWAIALYGLIAFATLWNLFGEFNSSQSYIYRYPFVYGLIYLIWFAIAVVPIVFMLRKDVKEYFSSEE